LCLAVPNLPRDPARDITISLRPEAISVHPMGPAGPNRLPATIEQIVYRGSLTHLYLRLAGGQSLLVHHQNRMGEPAAPLTPGSQILATWAEESNHVVLDA
jgi:ABC-type Fe3+/spermidine/putrescine transport system ATPase subunit